MKKLLIVDHGLFTAFAERLAQDFEVFYFVPYADRSFPKPAPAMVGSGLKGVTRVEDMWRLVPEVDLIMFPDVGFYQLQEFLRASGYKVWGSGLGEKLEVQRWRAKETMRALGLPVGKCALVTGMDELRAYIEHNEDVFVKISGFRGLAETFHAKNAETAHQRLLELEYNLGGLAKVFPFVCEHMVDSVVEAGYDGFCIDGNFPKTCLTGVEVKDRGYLGAVREDRKLAEPVKVVNQKLAPFLKEAEYRQFFSTEIRVTEDGTPYLIDLTTRGPLPPSELYHELIENLGEIIEAGAEGVLVEPKWKAKYGALAIIKSSFAEEHWCPVSADPKIAQFVKWRNCAVIEDQTYIVPTEGVKMPEIGAVVGIGNTIEEAIKHCQENAKGVDGFDVKIHAEAIPEALDEIAKGEKHGITFTDDPLPDKTKLMK